MVMVSAVESASLKMAELLEVKFIVVIAVVVEHVGPK